MPRAVDRLRLDVRRASDATWNLLAELLAAVVVWGAIGFGLDRVFHTGPWLLATGLLVGHGAGIYIAIWRGEQMRKARQGEKR